MIVERVCLGILAAGFIVLLVGIAREKYDGRYGIVGLMLLVAGFSSTLALVVQGCME